MENLNKKGFREYLNMTRKITIMKRYHSKFQLIPSTVASHSWFVSLITMHLVNIDNQIFSRNTDLGKSLTMATLHDIVEPITGDIPSPIKDSSPSIKKLLHELEEQLVENIIDNNILTYDKNLYTVTLKEYLEQKSRESFLVKSADIIDRLYECSEEVRLGNSEEYLPIFERDLQTLKDRQDTTINYFLDIIKPETLI